MGAFQEISNAYTPKVRHRVVCGVQEDKKLMEDIPNKVRDMMDNPDIANTFFRAGEIEAWERFQDELERINEELQETTLPAGPQPAFLKQNNIPEENNRAKDVSESFFS